MDCDRGTNHLKVSQPDCESICRVGFGRLGEAQERSHHKSYLRFLRRAVADDRLFYSSWRIFVDRHPMLRGRQKRGASRRAERHCGSQILNVNQAFDRAFFRGVKPDQFVDFAMNFEKAAWHR